MDKMTPERVISKLADLAERHAEAAKHYADQPSSFGQALAWTQEKAIASEYEAMAETVRTLQGERDRLREALEHEMRDVATEASRYREALKMIAIRAPAQKPEVHEDLDNRGDIADQASALATWECSQIALAALQAPFKEGSERD